ncbi:MAG: YmdB family metallophosphoesterase, partial [Actinomyces dentalis]
MLSRELGRGAGRDGPPESSPGAPGKGYCIYPHRAKNLAVLNLSGRVFMPDMDCPFQKIEEILREIRKEAD